MRRNHPQAAKWFTMAAEQGDMTSQAELGYLYSLGEGVSEDPVQAVRWWRAAAEQGHAGCMSDLAVAYADGEGVPQDYREAYAWAVKAAEHGDAQGQFLLGVAYACGKWGVSHNAAKAVKWFTLAARQGDAEAQAGLAAAYAYGKGCKKSHREAYIWASLAAAQDDETRVDLPFSNETAVRIRDWMANELDEPTLLDLQQEASTRWKTIMGEDMFSHKT